MELGGFEPPTSWVRCRAAVVPFPLEFGFLMRRVASSGARAESRIAGDMRRYAGIRALKRTSAQDDGVG
jgi:hypothetical protein